MGVGRRIHNSDECAHYSPYSPRRAGVQAAAPNSANMTGMSPQLPQAAHYLLLRYFSEMTLKSAPVRGCQRRQLQRNLRCLLGGRAQLREAWNQIAVHPAADLPSAAGEELRELLRRTPGIAKLLEVDECALPGLGALASLAVAAWGERIAGRRFAVRCRRVGCHPFSSQDVERRLGAELLRCGAAGVDLRHPEELLRLELRGQRALFVRRQWEGLGGFPLGSQGGALSLLSGGYDSAVASYRVLRRGLITHYCFFDLGAPGQEAVARQVALWLWRRHAASHRAHFHAVPFAAVMDEILRQTPGPLAGVVLKRAMLRAASLVAQRAGIDLLVTGDSLAQVSSQTPANLVAVDGAAELLVLRPLITEHKVDIIAEARRIGTAQFSEGVPESCAGASHRPRTRVSPQTAAAAEALCRPQLLQWAVAHCRRHALDRPLPEPPVGRAADDAVSVARIAAPGSVIIDLRAPSEARNRPLRGATVEILRIPSYELGTRLAHLPPDRQYLLYCQRGALSRLHAARLRDRGYARVAVYRPPG